MNAQQLLIIQQTFELIAPRTDELIQTFYARLFALDPALRSLFRGDLQQQGEKLMSVLVLVVRGLDQPETILGPVQRLGQRHAQVGVQPQHYATVGKALLATLAHLLGPAFTNEVADAWATAYLLLATLMQEAALMHGATQAQQGAPN